jgi:hypothetical protein
MRMKMILKTLLPVCLISLFFPFSAAVIAKAYAEEVLSTSEPLVLIEDLPPIQKPMPMSLRQGYSTLPGWSAGYRYNFNVDVEELSTLKLFIKRKSRKGHSIKMAWERQTGSYPNFFKAGTIDGVSLNRTGVFSIEQEIKF